MKKYEEPKLEVQAFDFEDVITDSVDVDLPPMPV